MNIKEFEEIVDAARDLITELDNIDSDEEKVSLADGIVRNLRELSFCSKFITEQNDVHTKNDFLITVNALRTYCSSLKLGDLKLNSAFNRIAEDMPTYTVTYDDDGIIKKPEDLVI